MSNRLARFLLASIIVISTTAFADTICVAGTLASYANTSCSVGNISYTFTTIEAYLQDTVIHYGVTTTSTVTTTNLDPKSIMVTPYQNGQQSGFTISGLPAVSAESERVYVAETSYVALHFDSATLASGATAVVGAGANIQGSNLHVGGNNGNTSGAGNSAEALVNGLPTVDIAAESDSTLNNDFGFENSRDNALSLYTLAPIPGCSGCTGFFAASNSVHVWDEGGPETASSDSASETSYFVTETPEPSGLLLLASGFVGCGRVLRRRSSLRSRLILRTHTDNAGNRSGSSIHD